MAPGVSCGEQRMDYIYLPGQTPLNADEKDGLIPTHITTQAELNEWEQLNIANGSRWASRQLAKPIMDDVFLRKLHNQMFGDTWKWAGTYRTSDKNIGCDWRHVSMRVRDLVGNTAYQIEHATMHADELAARFHHQLVLIHPFPNGNGRHSRLMTNLLQQQLGQQPFSWGGGEYAGLVNEGDLRTEYIGALRAADAGDIAPLMAFARK